MQFTINTLEELKDCAKLILEKSNYKIFAITGNLGAGKTALTQAIGEILETTEKVNSPTYSIVNEYHSKNGILYHFDLYRIENREELFEIGFEEYLDSGNLCFIEWPEIGEKFLPEHHTIDIQLNPNNSRTLTFN